MTDGSKMRFRRQVILGHAALVAIVLLIGGVSAVALRIVTGRLDRVAHDLANDAIAIERLRYQAEQVVAISRGYLLVGDPDTLERFEDAAARVQDNLAALDRRRTDLADEIAGLEVAANEYIAAARRGARERARVHDPSEVVPFFEETLAPARERFEAAMGAFAHEQQRMFADAAHRSRSLDSASEWIVSAASVAAVLLAGALAWLSIHRLSMQYARERAATEAARRATAAREEILAVVSHDLRNPLTAIAMGTNLLGETIEDPMHRKYVTKIANAASRMQSLIDQLLDIAQFESGNFALKRERCDVPELFDSVTSLFDVRAAEAGIEIHVEPYAAAVDADRERIIQVLSNLVANALKFTPRGGRVSLGAKPADAFVRFEVSDTGQGIAADQLPHLFERYWQGHSRGRGSLGLGLYICKQLVTAHGGELGVESVASSGSTFWFTLPRAPDRSAA